MPTFRTVRLAAALSLVLGNVATLVADDVKKPAGSSDSKSDGAKPAATVAAPAKPASTKPAPTKPVATKPATVKPETVKPATVKPASAEPASVEKTQLAIDRALRFMVSDVAKWRSEKGCATCHHGAMSVWVLHEAAGRGYAVDTKAAAEITRWAKDRFVPKLGKPRDPRFGYNLVSVPGIYFGLMSQTLPVLSRDEVNLVASHLANHQEDDGAWLMPPPKNGAPPVWESRETLALQAYLAWEPTVPADPQAAEKARTARRKAADWLDTTKPSDTVQSTALRLVLDIRTGKPAAEIKTKVSTLVGRQNSDGGWSPDPDLPSDAYATGQTMWALSFAGLEQDDPAIRRAVAFLISTQRENGSWPMQSRNHSTDPATKITVRNPMPITYFGSAWATLGLVRWVSPTLDLATRQKSALDAIQTYSGKHEVDEKLPGKPVVGVTLTYEVDDEELAGLVDALTAFPQLATLRIRSSRMSDRGLARLPALSQLRTLSIDAVSANKAPTDKAAKDAASTDTAPKITDAGLAHLRALKNLENLTLKGTQVSDGGVAELQKALPKAKIVR
jgi:hypothetical protein